MHQIASLGSFAHHRINASTNAQQSVVIGDTLV